MPFPNSPRVIYSNNPLERVICQLRFPPILKIDKEIPAAFQDIVRQQYPLFEEKHGDKASIPKQLLEQLPADFSRLLGASGSSKAYNFISLDKQWTVSLTRDFIALTASSYSRWEEFKKQFETPLDTLLSEYKPAGFSRVGLRYQNIIKRSILGLEDISWSELIQPYIAGPLAAPELDDNSIINTANNVEIRLQSNYGKVKIQYGFAEDSVTGEIYYLIDSDFFIEKIEEDENVLDRLERFNRRAGRLFRWCITPKLHEAMEPKKI